MTANLRYRARALNLPVLCRVMPERPSTQAVPPRAKKILDTIEANPGLTVFEYTQTTGEAATMINAILGQTEMGKWFARSGKVALPLSGVVPPWFVAMPEEFKSNVPKSVTAPVPRRPRPQVVTTRAKKVLDFVEAHPGYTVIEYSDLMTESREAISMILASTKLGQYLCMTGKVALPSFGSRPEWFLKIPDELQPGVPIRDPEPQLALTLPKAVRGKLARSWEAFGDDLVAMICKNTVSPNVRLKRLEQIAEHVGESLDREMAAQKTIKKLMLSAPIKPKPILALPAPESAPKKTATKRLSTAKKPRPAKVASTKKPRPAKAA